MIQEYAPEDLESAIQEYLATDKSQYQIAREHGVPRSTFNDYIRRLYGYVDEDMGRRALGLPPFGGSISKSFQPSLYFFRSLLIDSKGYKLFAIP